MMFSYHLMINRDFDIVNQIFQEECFSKRMVDEATALDEDAIFVISSIFLFRDIYCILNIENKKQRILYDKYRQAC